MDKDVKYYKLLELEKRVKWLEAAVGILSFILTITLILSAIFK
jgi:hypothetical protein